jgi:hypothetical protein
LRLLSSLAFQSLLPESVNLYYVQHCSTKQLICRVFSTRTAKTSKTASSAKIAKAIKTSISTIEIVSQALSIEVMIESVLARQNHGL